MAVDPGSVNIGIAISDDTGIVAFPLKIVKHVSRDVDAKTIVEIAHENHVHQIIVGCALDEEGNLTFEGRKANRLVGAIRKQTQIPVIIWDEYESTNQAQSVFREMKGKRKTRLEPF
jgi:putative Holliday junction resolvase